MIAPGIRGFVPEMNKRLPYDTAAAKKLWSRRAIPTASRSA